MCIRDRVSTQSTWGSEKGECLACDSSFLSFLRGWILPILIFAYLAYQIRVALSGIGDLSQRDTIVMMKIFQNHLQQLSLLSSIQLGWTPQLKQVFDLVDLASLMGNGVITLDCYFDWADKVHPIYLRTISTHLTPVFMLAVFSIFWLLYLGYKMKREGTDIPFRRNVTISSIVVVYLTFPGILRQTLKLLYCVPLKDDNSVYVLGYAPSVECFQTAHLLWASLFMFIVIFFWGVVIHGSMLRYLYRSREFFEKAIEEHSKKNLKPVEPNKDVPVDEQAITEARPSFNESKRRHRSIIELLFFLWGGFRTKRFYWEIVIVSRKSVLTIISIFTSYLSFKWKSTLILLYVITVIRFNFTQKPFFSKYLNRLENESLFSLYLTTLIGLVLTSTLTEGVKLTFSILIILVNLWIMIKISRKVIVGFAPTRCKPYLSKIFFLQNMEQ
eukprot:TRINITY_DN19909_c0_g1_i1.p1 TRINITY_DN19909_c0_g1~~TRINITY_DN19909_c0_g1_i1.p1  ORF type:complete len:462 (+),score=45.83 TRINITY_DN19909_c0_g1_i1:60-1388(+)